MIRCTKCSAVLNTCDCDWGATVDARSPEAILTAQVKDLQARVEALEAVYEAALLHVGQFTPYALHTLDLRNALAAAQTKQDEIDDWDKEDE